MKSLFQFIVFITISTNLLGQAKIEFEQKTINKVYMIEDETYEYLYQFKNTGKQPFQIVQAKGSSGDFCTQFPKEPIMPGKTGFIKVNYSTRNKLGTVSKTIHVRTNNENVTLGLKGIIIKGPTKENPFPVIHFENIEYDDKEIKRGLNRTYTYTYKNIGNAPLQINLVKTPCGCHTANWSKNPILPGETNTITNNFTTMGKGLGKSSHGVAQVKWNSFLTEDNINLINTSILVE